MAINTHKGLFQYNCLPFGVVSAPAICQRTMDSILQGLPHVCVYLDNILITGSTEEAQIKILKEVLHWLNKAGVHLKQKCSFMLPSVEYLGHRISFSGLQPTNGNIKSSEGSPSPYNVSQLKSCLSLLELLWQICTQLIHSPLSSAQVTWGPELQGAFDRVKGLLTSDSVLAHYDPSKALILACDTSPYGVGVVLSHQ